MHPVQQTDDMEAAQATANSANRGTASGSAPGLTSAAQPDAPQDHENGGPQHAELDANLHCSGGRCFHYTRCTAYYSHSNCFNICVALIRLGFLGLHSYAILECFIRELKMVVQCNTFLHRQNLEIISGVWLLFVSFISLFLIVYTFRSDFPGLKESIKKVYRELYFLRLCFLTVSACVYDVLSIAFADESQVERAFLYISYIIGHITSVLLMFTLNLVPSTNFKFYKLTFLTYSIENYVMYVLQIIVSAYKLVSFPTCTSKPIQTNNHNATTTTTRGLENNGGNTECHDFKSIVMLLLCISVISLRYQVGRFFLTKVYEKDVYVLDGASLQPNNPPPRGRYQSLELTTQGEAEDQEVSA